MPHPFRGASIRARLVLLVLALWLPAVVGLALQAKDAYQRQKEALMAQMRQQAIALGHAVQAELDGRQALAQALATSPSLRSRDLKAFDAEARAAVRGTAQSILLVDRTFQYIYTAHPATPEVPRRPDSLFVERGAGISYVAKGPVTGRPAIAVLVPEAGHSPPRFNVGAPILTSEVQALIGRMHLPEGAIAAIVDQQQRVMGRNRDPERWVGARASHPALVDLATRGGSGFIRTVTLDGVPSLTFLGPPVSHGWAALVALPQATFQATLRRVTLHAIAMSGLLLAIGLVVALAVARRISAPVEDLERAAAELRDRRVPGPLRTGLAEVDRVGAVLHEAGERARQAEQVLEARVAEAAEEARRAEAGLFDARKHEAIGRLTGGVAHDFNNLLQTISMGLQVVQRSMPEGRHARPLAAALAACGKAADLVRQMLAFGRAQQLRPQPVDLADLLLRSRELTGKALGERIELAAQLDPELPPVLADPTQLELALLNLVFNARDAMPDGGSVAVRAWMVEGSPEGLDDRLFVRIDVQDTGHGMEEETLARVFEPYFTTKAVGKGTGLGLPQVRAFARQSGGDVRIASTVGQGTCVTLLLPVSRGEAADDRPAPAHVRRGQKALRVLMVEDDVLVASVVQTALEHEGHRVTLCRTADEARVLLSGGVAADVLFTDIVMPGSMTGLELVQWCLQHRRELPSLVATGYSARPPEGVWKVLRKPYTIEDLLDALDLAALQPA
ncbi:MAG TPA: ATP-binding protein [Ramlibacter sp.]|nr:ATP-binding protein [Ramlibacter sp.]